jgi:hypothetical protein
VVDKGAKPQDVFSVALSAGVHHVVLFNSSEIVRVEILNPNSNVAKNGYGNGATCNWDNEAPPCTFTPAVNGNYIVAIGATGGGQSYTLMVKQS